MSEHLVSLLDFSHGFLFEDEMLESFGRRIHERHSRFEEGFIMLATFKRYLFQLNEDSVALALQSCLGGNAQDFHVQFISHNHFRFSVSCKSIGLVIYKLRQFIGKSFDVYFHLWNNGVPHWEREKRLWEIEEEKKWIKVVSKRQKKSQRKHKKRVRFAENLTSYTKANSQKFSGFNTINICSIPVALSQHLQTSPRKAIDLSKDSHESL